MARSIEFDRNDVLTNCMHVFWDQGFDATSITKLENATGLCRTSLYNSFGDKEKLFKQVIDHYIETQCVYWTDILLGEHTFTGGVDKLVSTMINENLDINMPTGCLITYSAAGIDKHSDEIRNRICRGHGTMIDGITAGLKNGVQTGEFTAELDIDSVALFLLNNFQGIMVLSRTIGSKKNLNEIKKIMLTTLSIYKS
tara:strand:- start:561 stop:1154 length:594 start_codon:yes stop_codon:yes gene_type:complete